MGDIATVGGQNYWDYVSLLIQQGTFGWLVSYGVGYNIDDLAAGLLKSLNKYCNIQIYWGYDICDYTTVSNPYRITSVTINPLCLDADKRVNWGSGAVQTLKKYGMGAPVPSIAARLRSAMSCRVGYRSILVVAGRLGYPTRHGAAVNKANRIRCRRLKTVSQRVF